MTDAEELELRLATTLSPMLLTVAIFSLGAMTAIQVPKTTIIDELLAFLASFCILSAAALVDAALDRLALTFKNRIFYLGGGYLLFCLVVSAMMVITPMLYEFKRFSSGQYGFHKSELIFFGGGACVLGKLMSYRDRQAWLVAIGVFYVFAIYVLIGE
jgi:hypothetical protein